jgi:nucleoside-diphosphate-sugar epimerase
MTRSVVFIGGTGTLSWWCVRSAIEAGWAVSVLNRGNSDLRPLPPQVELLRADVHDVDSASAALRGRSFDVVADFLSFTPEHLEANIQLLGDNTDQYIYVSSASAYQKPVASLPITESTPLVNPFWEYAREKIACEDYLTRLAREAEFPATIVRPSHTYDAGSTVTLGGWTDILRMREGRPVIVHGDGTSLWTLTHASDFAYCFTALLGDRRAIGNTFHITGDEVIPWDAIYTELAQAAGVRNPTLVHVASDTIGQVLPEEKDHLLGDKAHSLIFDNSKIRALAGGFVQRVPWAIGARQIVEFHDQHPRFAVREPEIDAAFDQLAGL